MELPCDICGKKVEFEDITEESLGMSGYFVTCNECGTVEDGEEV